MNHRSLKIFIACFIGAGMGTTVALQLQAYLWWIGFIVGGIVGYLSYEFREVVKAVKIAYERVMEYRPDKEKWVLRFWIIIATVCVLVSSLLASCVIIFPAILTKTLSGEVSTFGEVWTICMLLPISLLLAIPLSLTIVETENYKPIKKVKYFALLLNPIGMLLYWVWILFNACKKIKMYAPVYAPKILPVLKKTIIASALFIKTVFILIHSEERLLCMVDAAIGTGIGYCFGSAIIGALAGGIFGVLNFEILSKRVLKLVPVSVRK